MIKKLNRLGHNKTPFIFIIDFDIKSPIIIPLNEIDNNKILFNINNFTNYKFFHDKFAKNFSFKKHPISFKKYKSAFNSVINEQKAGNSYLLNLTFPTYIETNLTLKEIFFNSIARYKLLYKNNFVVFSPEQFVTIKDNIISSFPMKGTISSIIPNAKEKILLNEKEFAEHITIVDLIRNDLGIISNDVFVKKFRFVDEIMALDQNLLQVSSEICGTLDNDWRSKLGDIIFALLPAGSVTGAPKQKTIEIIKRIENYNRGYYTGIFGYFDGNILDSAVMIRFIENINNSLYFKSGGGITIYSDVKSEYHELLDKVYVPIVRNN